MMVIERLQMMVFEGLQMMVIESDVHALTRPYLDASTQDKVSRQD